jgi:hypothetical protein
MTNNSPSLGKLTACFTTYDGVVEDYHIASQERGSYPSIAQLDRKIIDGDKPFTPEQIKFYAELFAEAGNVYHKTGFSPLQLLEKLKEQ